MSSDISLSKPRGHGRMRIQRAGTRAASAVMCGILAFSLMTAPSANAHYVPPRGDDEAAPALVQVSIAFRFTVILRAKRGAGFKRYREFVAGPPGTGVVINPAGQILTTHATAFPDAANARDVAINTAFRTHYRTNWASSQLGKKQTVSNARINRELQQCYRLDSPCVISWGRVRKFGFNTEQAKPATVGGRYDVSERLTILTATPSPDSKPTVLLGGAIPLDRSYVALGYDQNSQLVRTEGVLRNGALSPEDQKIISTKYRNGGDSAVLVDRESKGTVIAVVRRMPTKRLELVSGAAPVANAGIRNERGPLDDKIDQALGYFAGEHYTHAVPLLESVTQAQPDRELLAKLETARKLKGTPEDMSEADSIEQSANQPNSTLVALLAVGLAVIAAVVIAVVVHRRRRQEPSGNRPSSDRDDEVDDDMFEDQEFEDDIGIAGFEHAEAELLDPNGVSVSFGDEVRAAELRGAATKGSGATIIGTKHQQQERADHYCPQCGAGLFAGDRFCYHCGTPSR